jgi:hypothetical protein
MDTVEVATQRVLQTYALMFDDEKAEAVRETVVEHIERRLTEGETDDGRLAVSALSYLRNNA